jgi:hypothetical protein
MVIGQGDISCIFAWDLVHCILNFVARNLKTRFEGKKEKVGSISCGIFRRQTNNQIFFKQKKELHHILVHYADNRGLSIM